MAIGQALKLEFLLGKSFIIVADGPPFPGEDPFATPNCTAIFNHLEPWHRIFTFFSWEAVWNGKVNHISHKHDEDPPFPTKKRQIVE